MEAIVRSEGHQVTTRLSICICLYTQAADQLADWSVTLFIHLTLLRSTIRCLYSMSSPSVMSVPRSSCVSWLVPCDPLLPVFVTLLSFYCSHFWILDNQLITAHLLYYLPERMWPELIRCVAHRWPLSAAFQLTDHLKSSESPLPREITLIGCSV